MTSSVSNNNKNYTAKDFMINAGGAAAGGIVYLAANKGVKKATVPQLSKLARENFAKTDTVQVQQAIKKVLDNLNHVNDPIVSMDRINIIDFSKLPKISAPQSKWNYFFNKVKPENIDRTGFTKEILEQEKRVDSTLKRMVPKWKRNINGFAEYHQKMLRYMLQEGFTAMAIFQDKNIFANMPKMGAAVFHEIGHLMEPVSNIQAIKMKSPLPYFIAGSLLMPKLDTGENGEKKLNKGLNILRNCTPILAAAAWIPLIKTEFEASSDGVKITKPFLDNQNLNILKKAYKYAGSTYVMGAVATGLALFAGLKCKDWLLENRKQIAKKIQDKI